MKRLRLISIIVAILVGGGLVFYLARSKEPKYQGRTLSQWLTIQLKYKHDRDLSPEWIASTDAVHHIGTNAIPTLLHWLQTPYSPVREKLNRLLDKQSLISFRFKSYYNQIETAEAGFETLGREGISAVPSLIQLFSLPHVFPSEIRHCIVSIDEDRTLFSKFIELRNKSPDRATREAALLLLYENYRDESEKTGIFSAPTNKLGK